MNSFGSVKQLANVSNLPVASSVLADVASWSDVTRLASLTDLDFLGMPVIAAIRTMSQSLSVASGKGATLAEALTSAVMEAYEHAAAENIQPLVRMADAKEAMRNAEFADPSILPTDRRAPPRDAGSPIRWVQFEKLTCGEPIWIPYDMVHLRLTCDEIARNDGFLVSTNGLAAGKNYQDAVLHGLCEVIERDAIAFALDEQGVLRLDRIAPLDLAECSKADPSIERLIADVSLRGCSVLLNDLTHEIGVPVIHCRIFENSDTSAFVRPCDGVGCATNPVTALRRAVFEAAQARATLISGARDDVLKRNYHVTSGHAFERPKVRSWSAIPQGPENKSDALQWLLDRLYNSGFHDAAALKLDQREGAVAVRVVVSGLEGVPMSPGYVRGKRVRGEREANALSLSLPNGAWKGRGNTTSSNRPVVFLGPTLQLDKARRIVDADFQPPAAQGDVYRVARKKPPAILLIDGTFLSSPTVWHKEILYALSENIPVLGAASLGALRAAELSAFGMIGVGKVFEDYYGAALRADDLVAVQFSPKELGYLPLTDAAVDIAATLERALAEGIIGHNMLHSIWQLVEGTHFSQRQWASLLQKMEQSSQEDVAARDEVGVQLERLKAWLPDGKLSQKAKDAEAALKRLKTSMESGFVRLPRIDLPETLLWAEMQARETNPFLRYFV